MTTETELGTTPQDQAAIAKVDEVSKSLGAPGPQAQPPATPQVPEQAPAATPASGEQPPKGEAEQVVQAAGLDMNALSAEFADKGQLSEASYAALEKAGIGKDVVDGYIAGQQALVSQRETEGHSLVGGKDQYSTMVQWASANMSPAEIETFNKSVTGTPAEMKQAILGLKASYEAVLGAEPKLVAGQRGASQEDTPFASRSEVTAAMRDSRYSNDPAYRAQVERRIGLMDNF
ncbi:MAG: capsid assembly protein [Comamonadaceae bacterium]|nr:capsid assembly protein [Comamonadaceae bacterium]